MFKETVHVGMCGLEEVSQGIKVLPSKSLERMKLAYQKIAVYMHNLFVWELDIFECFLHMRIQGKFQSLDLENYLPHLFYCKC